MPAHTGAIQNILVAQLLVFYLFHLEHVQPAAMHNVGFLLHSKVLMQLPFFFQDSPSLHLPEQRRVRGHLGEAGREAPGQRRSRFEHFWSLTLVRLFHTSEYV